MPISKETKRFRRKLLDDQLIKYDNLPPGSYQMEHQQTRGKIMRGVLIVGITGMALSGAYFVVGIFTANGFFEFIEVLGGTALGLISGLDLLLTTKLWSNIDQFYQIRKIVYNRYYCVKVKKGS